MITQYKKGILRPDFLLNNKLLNSKRSQQEILGFVLIVLIICIVIVLFLSFSIGKGQTMQNSQEVSNLLQASMYYTTDCSVSYLPNYEDIQGLIGIYYQNRDSNQKCLPKKICKSSSSPEGEITCTENEERYVKDVLEETLKKVLDDSLHVSEDSPRKAYKLDIYYIATTDKTRENLLNISNGVFRNCTSQPGSQHQISAGIYSSEKINIDLVMCNA